MRRKDPLFATMKEGLQPTLTDRRANAESETKTEMETKSPTLLKNGHIWRPFSSLCIAISGVFSVEKKKT